jgi:hypothetical protein
MRIEKIIAKLKQYGGGKIQDYHYRHKGERYVLQYFNAKIEDWDYLTDRQKHVLTSKYTDEIERQGVRNIYHLKIIEKPATV